MRRIHVALAAVVIGSLPFHLASAGPTSRVATAGHFALQLEREAPFVVAFAEGGAGVAEVVEEPLVPGSSIPLKHLGAIDYQPVLVGVGASGPPALHLWLGEFLEARQARKSCSLVMYDASNHRRGQLDLSNALIGELRFPALDATSQDVAHLTLGLAPESTAFLPGDGANVAAVAEPSSKRWYPSNYRIQIGDLPCNRIKKVDGFSVKQQILPDSSTPGGRVPGKIEYPNLTFHIPMLDLPAWDDFYEQFVVNGQNGSSSELTGRIDLLAADLQTVLLRVQLSGVGISKLQVLGAASDAPGLFTVDLYVESMTLGTP
jgi:hypothetical protein